MRKMTFLAGALTIAAALALAVVSCTSDDSLTNENQSENTQPVENNKIHVSVGAGMNEGPQTKSVVGYNSTTHERKLKFSAGDRLYVRGVISTQKDKFNEVHDNRVLAGYLDINESSISPAGTSATFSGDLQAYEGDVVETEWKEVWVEDLVQEVVDYDENGNEILGWVDYGCYETDYDNPTAFGIEYYYEIDYDFGSADPLSECADVYAILVHKDAGQTFTVDYAFMVGYYDSYTYMAASANDIMTMCLSVSGYYEAGRFSLAVDGTYPIINCTISGLTPGTSYDALYLTGPSSYDENSNFLNGYNLVADSQGKVSFAFIGYDEANYYHAIRLENADDYYDWKLVDLGQKTLTGTVYNVSRTAVDDPDTPPRPVKPTLSRSDGLSTDELILDAPNPYDIFGTLNEGDPYDEDDNYYEEDVNMTISGNSTSYCFRIHNGGTVTLTGGGTAISEFPFLQARGSLTVMLGSDYTIDCRSSDSGIGADDYVYLGSVSGTHTLTIIVEEDTYDGIENYCGLDAASGCSYILYSRTTNPDGTYTFVYRLTKN